MSERHMRETKQNKHSKCLLIEELEIKIFNSMATFKNKDIAYDLETVKCITWFFYENFILHSPEYKYFSKWK